MKNYILYYSNFCKFCGELIQKLAREKNEDIHFICLDKRKKNEKGDVLCIMNNGETLILPPNVSKVPSLLLLNRGNRIIVGSNEIYSFLKPEPSILDQKNHNQEPLAYSFGYGSGYIISDTYSYVDTPPSELEAKGNGGLRILHNYATLDYTGEIETPPDTYTSERDNTLNTSDIEKQTQYKEFEG